MDPTHLRFFVSSPGDVADERAFAQQVIEQELPKDPLLRGQITCEVARWDDPSAPTLMPATLTPQEAVNRGLTRPSQCDVVIVILFSRMGTPLPDSLRKADGSPYLSGTEWEFEDAMNARPPPLVLVYRCTAKVSIDAEDPDAEAKLEQRRRVKQFFQRFRSSDGSLKGGFADYATPQEFRDRLRVDLRAFVQTRLKSEAPVRSQLPVPYAEIARALSTGRVVPIIGPGASARAQPAGAPPLSLGVLPSGVDLSRCLADDSGFPSEQDRDRLAEVASFYEAFGTRAALRARLRQLLDPDAGAGAVVPALYRLLADVPVPLLIISANYDTLLERAFREANKPYDLVVYPADRKDLANAVLWWPHGADEPKTPPPNALDVDLNTTTVIFKMHGSILPKTDAWDGFVITEEDYVEFLSRISGKASAIPAVFSAHVHDRSLLFINYSLRDWNSRIILRSLSRYFARRVDDDEGTQSWAIEAELSDLEDKLWRKRAIYPYQVDIDAFVARLREKIAT